MILYNQSIEVTERQHNLILRDLKGLVAHRKHGNKYFVKLWMMKYSKHLTKLLKQ